MSTTPETLLDALKRAIFAIPDEQLISRDIIIHELGNALAAANAAPTEQARIAQAEQRMLDIIVHGMSITRIDPWSIYADSEPQAAEQAAPSLTMSQFATRADYEAAAEKAAPVKQKAFFLAVHSDGTMTDLSAGPQSEPTQDEWRLIVPTDEKAAPVLDATGEHDNNQHNKMTLAVLRVLGDEIGKLLATPVLAGKCVDAVLAALSQTIAEDEPYAWTMTGEHRWQLTYDAAIAETWRKNGGTVVPLYTRPQPQEPKCPTCRGNDGNIPCGHPSKGAPGCLRDVRLAKGNQRAEDAMRLAVEPQELPVLSDREILAAAEKHLSIVFHKSEIISCVRDLLSRKPAYGGKP